jgi:ABC-type lipoprotein release transport system permease subunit
MRWLAIVGFSPNFASSVSGAVAILGVVAIAVSRPAWRARKTDPLTILRQQ